MVERAKLIRLPNGAWVRPDAITRIVPLAPSAGYGGNHLPRVTVWCGHLVEVIEFPGMDEAREWADELAEKVNGDA